MIWGRSVCNERGSWGPISLRGGGGGGGGRDTVLKLLSRESLYLLFCSSSCSTKVESHSWHSNKVREQIQQGKNLNQDSCTQGRF